MLGHSTRTVVRARLPASGDQAHVGSNRPRITKSVFDVLTVERSVASRTSFGGTAPENVARAAAAAKKRFLK